VQLTIEDSSALVLTRMGVALPHGARGRPPKGALVPAHAVRALPEAQVPRARANNVAALEARLRALGYVD